MKSNKFRIQGFEIQEIKNPRIWNPITLESNKFRVQGFEIQGFEIQEVQNPSSQSSKLNKKNSNPISKKIQLVYDSNIKSGFVR